MDLSGAAWRKAARSTDNGGACVEVAGLRTFIAVRDSKDPHGPHLAYSRDTWTAFARRVKSGELDAP